MVERRTEKRQSCSEAIFFATRIRLYEGQLENYTRRGLFIRTTENFDIGEVVTVAIPFTEEVDDKRKGQILWKNQFGIGVELFTYRDHSDPRTIRLERKITSGRR